MRTRLDRVPALLLACLLPACGTDPDNATTGMTESTTSSTGAPTTGTTPGENTGPGITDSGEATSSTSTGEDPTGTVSVGDTSTGTVSGGDTSTGTVSVGDTSTGAVSVGDTSTGDPSTGDPSVGDTSTSTGDTSTGDTSTGDTSTGEPGGLGPAAQGVVMTLEEAVDGVYFLSESDYPWTVFAVADAAPVSEVNVKDVIAEVYVPHGDPTLADRATELRTLAQLMDPLTVMQNWWGPEEVERAEQYQPIRDIFEDQLVNVKVFRFGQKFGNVLMGQVDVFVIGETADGDVVGMFTISVET